jgi:Concanavalin A-like lectin/glucanases superfamily
MAVQLTAAQAAQLINNQSAALNIPMFTTAGASSPFSINVWIKTSWGTSAASVGRISLVGLYGPSPNPTSALQIGATTGSGELSFWTWGGGVLIGSGTDYMNAYNNVWVNIGYTYDGTNHVGYINGVQVLTSTTAQLAGNLQLVTLNGYPTGGAGETWNHIVDAYALYNRVLTAGEMLSIYDAGGSRHGNSYGRLCIYEFDEGVEGSNVTTNSVLDTGPNALTLVLTGAGTPPKYRYTTSYADTNIRPVLSS